ncbi:hypothetical protein NQ315_015179 [Exocentrus adspersus]|uniref:Uncharacterized protein n=1 Tax=Exocentrus adspersus TaxID=1586481 RepID=A0AAV8VJ54_9CUCU|nr:hypothetical protein NQ315_015179 [Exocentrus adspersus]
MNDSAEVFSTPKLINGEGDGIKNITVRRRVQVPSSRKFNANIPTDESMRIRIGDALNELQRTPKTSSTPKSRYLKKSQTVAEITPTKSKVKSRCAVKSTNDDGESSRATLHATPRPVDGETPTAASASRRCLRERAECVVYQRLLLCVWRRNRERLATLSESCGRHQDQINQLELQVDVLKTLRNSESQKRVEALNESQQLRKKLEMLELESNELNKKLSSTQEELKNTQENLKLTRSELKKSSEQITSLQLILKKKKEGRLELLAKISAQEYEILKQNSVISQLEEQLKTIGRNLQNSESNYRAKQEEYGEAVQQLQNEVNLNISLNEQLHTLQETKMLLENQTKELENQLDEYSRSCEELIDENITMRCNLHEVTMELNEVKKEDLAE